jgi:hypothetical protein
MPIEAGQLTEHRPECFHCSPGRADRMAGVNEMVEQQGQAWQTLGMFTFDRLCRRAADQVNSDQKMT